MQRKDLALRVLSTAAIMSIVTSIAAPAFAGTYYMENGNLSIRQDAEGKVWVKSGNSDELEDKDKEVIICGGTGENQWSNAPSGGATAATGTEDSAAGESQPDPDAGFTLSEAEEDSAQNQEGKDTTENPTENPTANPTEDTPKPSTENPTENPKKDVVYEYDPADPEPEQQATKLAPTTSADPEEKTLKTTQADTTTTPAAETEPSTKLEDVTVDTAYKPAAPTSAASSNWISVVNNCLNKVLNIRLSDVNIQKKSNDVTAPMTVDGSGDTTIELDGNNVLDAYTSSRTYAAGLEKKGTGTLTITDTDSITADGTQDNTLRGSLTAVGGWEQGAGIGSRSAYGAGPHDQTENITIAGNAYVNAWGRGNAAGIGGGQGRNAKNITIKDNAYVVAEGGSSVGIGSGTGGGSSDVKIQGGTVVAKGFYTGIGGHYNDSDTSGKTETSTIEISGGTVYANGNRSGDKGVSIGSVGGNSKITISGDAKVKNTGPIGSYASYDVKDEGISSTIIIKDNAMIADDSGAIGGNTNTNITIQDNAVIGNLRKFGPRPNEWSGYIGTCTGTSDRIYDAKATVQIKDNVLIKHVAFIGGKYITSDVKIKIQDNAHIKKIGFESMSTNTPAIGSDLGRVDVTIGGSSDPNKPQQGTVRIDEAIQPVWGSIPVIGTGSGSGNVSIKENVQLGLVRAGTKHYKTPDYVKSDKVITPGDLRDMIGKDSTISLKNGETNELEYIVHGKNVCAHVTGEETGRKQDATCTEDGWVEYRCNYEALNGATKNSCDRIWTETIPKKGHTWGEWTITPATCTSNGSKERECSVCHQKETETITALGHDFHGAENVTKAATCTTEGIKLVKCTRCDVWETQIIPALKHDWGDWQVTTSATCTTKGVKTRYCKRDQSHVETQEIPATGHQQTHIEGKKEPTCTEPGYTGDEVCDACGTVVKKGTVIPALGHHWKDNGDGTHTCPDCGATEGQPVNTNSALELRVVDAEGMDQPFTVSQNGTLRTYTGAYDTATLTGDLNTLCYLQEHGAQTIQFVTNGQTSSFAINDLLAQGSGSEVFYLTHRGAEEPTLLLVEADHSDLL